MVKNGGWLTSDILCQFQKSESHIGKFQKYYQLLALIESSRNKNDEIDLY
jgi:hypothetical protein